MIPHQLYCRRSWLLFIWLLFVISGSGYSQVLDYAIHPPSLLPTNEWGTATNDCQLGLRIPKLRYLSGEPIRAAVLLRNLGDRRLGCTYAGDYLTYDVSVKRVDGGDAPFTASWSQAREHLDLSVGEVSTIEIKPHEQQYRPAWLDVTSRYNLDTAGEYVVIVKQKLDLYEILSWRPYKANPIGRCDIYSNPVTITVVPKPAK